MSSRGFRPRKRLGQHFLKKESDAQEIVAALSLTGQDTVLEIGPGMGILSRHLVEAAKDVIAIEIDERLIPYLESRFGQRANFHLIRNDILQCDLNEFRLQYDSNKLKVIGNLPYAVTTPILFFLLEYKTDIELIVVTLQKEVAQRILAFPGGKEYGALSVAIQYHCAPEHILNLPAGAFHPKPKVESTVLSLRMLPAPPISVNSEDLFFRVVRAAYGQRRKMLRNALSAILQIPTDRLGAISEETGIDLRRRGETLSLAEFGLLSDAIGKMDSLSEGMRKH